MFQSSKAKGFVVGASLLGFAAIVSSAMLASALKDIKREHYVSVKGVSERVMEADFAVWPMRITAAGDQLTEVQKKLDADTAQVADFLVKRGIPAKDTALMTPEVTDANAQAYRSGPAPNRFVVAQVLLVRTTQVKAVQEASREVGELLKQGIVLGQENSYNNGPFYQFTQLNDVKPEMIAEATRNAREAAQQFAKDSGTEVGDIRQASQGLFQILPYGEVPNYQEQQFSTKKLRVVTTVDYSLE